MSEPSDREPCFSCGALVPKTEGPTHDYMLSLPGCWAVYGEVLAREYERPSYMVNHRLTVDAYAVQHPGEPTRAATRSVWLHLVGCAPSWSTACRSVEQRRSSRRSPIGRKPSSGSSRRRTSGRSRWRKCTRPKAPRRTSPPSGGGRAPPEAWSPHHEAVNLRVESLV